MDKITLTEKDLYFIEDYATKLFIEKNVDTDHFNVKCTVEAFLTFLNKNNLKVQGGEIYKN